MPLPTPVEGGTIVHVTELRNVGPNGWSENYYAHVTGTGDPLEAAANSHARIITRRAQVMSNAVTAVACRFSDETVFGDSALYFPDQLGLGPGLKGDDGSYTALGWMVTMTDASSTISDTRIYRGFPANLVPFSPAFPLAFAPPAAVTAWSEQMSQYMRLGYTAGGANVRYVIRSFMRPGVTGTTSNPAVIQYRCDNFEVATNGKIQFRVFSSAPLTWNVGDEIKLKVPRKKCLKGLSGTHKVTSIFPVTTVNNTVTIDLKLCCGNSELEGVVGQAYKQQLAYYPITSWRLGRVGKRDTGRGFFVTRGRQLGACC